MVEYNVMNSVKPFKSKKGSDRDFRATAYPINYCVGLLDEKL